MNGRVNWLGVRDKRVIYEYLCLYDNKFDNGLDNIYEQNALEIAQWFEKRWPDKEIKSDGTMTRSLLATFGYSRMGDVLTELIIDIEALGKAFEEEIVPEARGWI